MAIDDDIQAIRESALDEDTKRKQIYALKSGSLYNALLPFKQQSYNYAWNGVTYSWTLWDIWLEQEGTILALTLRVTGTGSQSGVVHIRPQRVFRFVNPPVLDKAGTDDRIAAAREMLAGLLP